MHVGKIIRSIGYMISFDVQQGLVAKVDINGSGKLDQREFRKMIRLINQQDLQTIRLAYHQSSQIESSRKSVARARVSLLKTLSEEDADDYRALTLYAGEAITLAQARLGLQRLGCVDECGRVEPILASDKVGPDNIDLFGFSLVARRSRQKQRSCFRKNGGFNKDEIAALKDRFREFDADNSGDIDQDELGNVMKKLGLNPTQAEIQDMIRGAERGAADGTFDGKIDWKEFLHMMAKSMNTKDVEDEWLLVDVDEETKQRMEFEVKLNAFEEERRQIRRRADPDTIIGLLRGAAGDHARRHGCSRHGGHPQVDRFAA